MINEIVDLLRVRGWRLAVAESCTAGALAERIARLEGAGDVFAGGVVAYQKRTKEKVLGLPHEALNGAGGAVTGDVAERMAAGVMTLMGTELGLATTGVLGPAADEDGNPVGRIFVGAAFSDGQRRHVALDLTGTPESNRRATIDAAMVLAVRLLRRATLAQ